MRVLLVVVGLCVLGGAAHGDNAFVMGSTAQASCAKFVGIVDTSPLGKSMTMESGGLKHEVMEWLFGYLKQSTTAVIRRTRFS
jgi:hypothetical protein